MINSWDLLEQIGFIIDPPFPYNTAPDQNQQQLLDQKEGLFEIPINDLYSTARHTNYLTSLEIELGENECHILQITSSDDPRSLAVGFCQKHHLNQFAVQIIENKINDAIKREEQKHRQMHPIHFKSDSKTNPNKIIPLKNCNQELIKNTSYKNNTDTFLADSPKKLLKSATPSKKKQQNQTTAKQISKKTQRSKSVLKQKSSPAKPKNLLKQKTLNQACQNLYFRGVLQTKGLEQKRIKLQQQREKKEQEQLTFKPKINQVSEKIIQFRKETGNIPVKKMKKQPQELFEKQLEECTFVPQINPISKIIVHNRQAYRNEDDHFNQLFLNTEKFEDKNSVLPQKSLNSASCSIGFPNKKSKQYLLEQKELSQKLMFKPKLNPKSIQQVKQPFNVRLSRAVEMKQKIKDGEFMGEEFTFQPQIGRPPYQQSSRATNSNKQNIPVWEQLYKQSQIRAKQRQDEIAKSRQQLKNSSSIQNSSDQFAQNSSSISQDLMGKSASNVYYENLIQKRVNQVFELLDSNKDGKISPNIIGIQNLSKNLLLFLKPIFEEMDQLNAELNYNEFKKAVINLLNDSDPYKKGLFLTEHSKNYSNLHSFNPKINSKSKAMIQGRISTQIHTDLYQQGIKRQKKKQFMLEKQRARKQQKQLEECSFKPCLHLGRKDYQTSMLNKKLSQIQFSINQSSNFGEEFFQQHKDEQY